MFGNPDRLIGWVVRLKNPVVGILGDAFDGFGAGLARAEFRERDDFCCGEFRRLFTAMHFFLGFGIANRRGP